MTGHVSHNEVSCPLKKLGYGSYWVTLGIRNSSRYMTSGKASLTVLEEVNVTSSDIQYINHRATNADVTIFGAL